MKTIENNKEFTQAWQARSSFKQARSLIDLIERLNLDKNDLLAAALLGAIAGYYSAPFMGNNRLGHLDQDDMPQEHQQIHEHLRRLRDKVFMHLDANVDFEGRQDITSLRVTIPSDFSEMTINCNTLTPGDIALHKIVSVLDWWVEELSGKISEYMTTHEKSAIIAPGHYILKLDGVPLELEPDPEFSTTE